MSSISSVVLGGLKDHLKEIKRCKRLIMIGCGTSFHAAVAVSSAIKIWDTHDDDNFVGDDDGESAAFVSQIFRPDRSLRS